MAHLFKDGECYSSFKAAYDSSASACEHAHIVRNYDIMMQCMKQSGLLEELVLPTHHVGVHVMNRCGEFMSGQAMMAKGRKIVSVGTSRNLCGPERCACIEDPPGFELTCKRVVQTAEGCNMFATPSKHIRYGSLGAGHWNQFLTRAYGSPWATKSLTRIGSSHQIQCSKIYARGD